jgi:hypothetical protein
MMQGLSYLGFIRHLRIDLTLGTRAKEDIKKGENVLFFGGVIIHKSQIEEYWKIMGHVGAQIDDDFFIVPTSREELKARGVT